MEKKSKLSVTILIFVAFGAAAYWTIYSVKERVLGQYHKVTLETKLNHIIKDKYVEYGSTYIDTQGEKYVIYNAYSIGNDEYMSISSNCAVGDSIIKVPNSDLIKIISNVDSKSKNFFLQ